MPGPDLLQALDPDGAQERDARAYIALVRATRIGRETPLDLAVALEVRQLGEAWRPHRSLATAYLYSSLRSR